MKRHAEQSIPQDGKCIRYDRETKDFACYLNGEFIGYAANYSAGEQLCNEVYYAQLSHGSAPPEPAPSPEPPPPDPWPLVARAAYAQGKDDGYKSGFDQGFTAALDLIYDRLQARKAEAEAEANARLIAAAPELLAQARKDLAAFDRIVELIEEARTSRNLDAILDIMADYAGSPALADVVKRLDTTTPAE